MIAKLLFLIVLVIVFIQLYLTAVRRIHTARIQISKVEKTFLPDDRLAQYAQELADTFCVGEMDCYHTVQARLASYFAYITSVYRQLNVRAAEGSTLPAAAEWILDNYYIVEKQVAKIEDSLSRKLLQNIPAITEGEQKGNPVAYALAKEFVAHRGMQVEYEPLKEFLGSYTRHAYLNSDEIWLFFDMVKLVLVENIAYLCKRIRFCNKEQDYAKKYCAYVLSKQGDPAQMKEKVVRYFSRGRVSKTFVSAFLEELKKAGEDGARITAIMSNALERRGMDARQMILDEQALQAQYQTNMGGCIQAIAGLGTINLEKLYDEVSEPVRLLKADPAGVYEQMDTDTKRLYQDEVRSIAEKSKVTESMAAGEALRLAQRGEEIQTSHVGYYLLGAGRNLLLERLGCRKREKSKAGLFWLYTGSIWGAALLVGVLVCAALWNVNPYTAFSVGILTLLLSTQPAAEIVNAIAAKMKKPKPIPKLALAGTLPSACSTFVVTTALLLDKEGVDELVEHLEDFYLLNQEENLYFAILADYKDSEENTVDEDLQHYAQSAVDALNERYPAQQKRFYFLLRRRIFSETEGRWMGAERKRGALCDFVRLLKTGEQGDFIHITDDYRALAVKYVITLDADTKLHHGTVARMVGAMAHPLNLPVLDEAKRIVTGGYAILQPKVGIDIESAGKTFYTKVYAAYGGLDAYSGAVSDVYQDLFGEGIFVGKGIFDVDVFYRVLADRFPKERILSHDLLEGSYLRCGLLSDTEVSDSYPPKYLSHISRLHRWVRGDWQLLPWLGAKTPEKAGEADNPLGALARYKIFDNLRRSVLPCIRLVLLVIAFFLPGPHCYGVAALALLLGAYPLLCELYSAIASRLRYRVSAKFNARILFGAKRAVTEFLLGVTMLVYEAYQMADAIIRTLYRLCVSKKHMLSWVTAQAAEKRDKTQVSYHYRTMWASPLLGAFLLVAAFFVSRAATPLCVLFGLWWIAAPWFACEISRPVFYKNNVLKQENKALFSLLARQMWGYFEDFSTAEHNFLVPDNVQMEPKQKVAARTSPTNIGLPLASTLCARDFGYITTGDMLLRINRTLDTVDKLEKWQGQLLNWYNTKTLEAMPPRYVSTVDNGNYIADLIALRQGILEYIGQPNVTKKHMEALYCTAQLAVGEDETLPLHTEALQAAIKKKSPGREECIAAIDALVCSIKTTQEGWAGRLLKMADAIRAALANAEKHFEPEITTLSERIKKIVDSTSFAPLYNPEKKLFSIGYDITAEKLNNSYYDLLMSEARQTSYIAVARGEVDYDHWFKLGRSMAVADLHSGLLSWTGTMFEFLMPLLLMKSYRNTVFEESYNFALREQMKYALKFAPVYGISESGFYSFDADLNYAYKAFGVPVLGLKRGLANDRVIAPYASVMSAMLAPNTAAENMKKLVGLGAYGTYGFYEALDFTKRRLVKGEDYAVVKSFMVHHVGMSFLAMENVFFHNILQKRFLKEPFIRAGSYLLGERIPINPPVSRATKYEEKSERREKKAAPEKAAACERSYAYMEGQRMPGAHILSNKNYMMYLNSEGDGFARLGDLCINRFTSYDNGGHGGFYIFITEESTGKTYPATFLRGAPPPESGSVAFLNDKAVFSRRDSGLDTKTQITVCPDENAQIHQIEITNHDEQERTLALTYFTEAILTRKQDDEAHRAFSGLFVSTQFDAETQTLLATRRKRFPSQKGIWTCLGIAGGEDIQELSYETDREKFLGRNNTVLQAQALKNSLPLTNSTGAVLDPVLAMRVTVKVRAMESVSLSFILSAAETKEEAQRICGSMKGKQAVQAAFIRAQAYATLFLRYLGLKFGISGDLPFVLCEIASAEMLSRVNWALKIYRYYNSKGLPLDLVFVCGGEHSYSDGLFQTVQGRAEQAGTGHGTGGRIFVLEGAKLEAAERNLLVTTCTLVLDGKRFPAEHAHHCLPAGKRATYASPPAKESEPLQKEDLLYYNGYGGFAPAENEYVIGIKNGEGAPTPWSNILANEQFGAVVTESGGGFTYSCNSALNKLTPWSNDAVSDPAFEKVYIKDIQSGYIFTPTRDSCNTNQDYMVRHGLGYSRYLHNENAVNADLCVFVPHNAPVKASCLTLTNTAHEVRKFALTYALTPLLGQKADDARFITTRFDNGVLYAENVCNADFAGMTAFIACSEPIRSYTADAHGFEERTAGIPNAVLEEQLNGDTGAGRPPVLALQAKITLAPGEVKQIVFLLGQTRTEEAGLLAKQYTQTETVEKSFVETKQYWDAMTGGILVKTPDPSMDLMLNGRMLYQTIACRLFARSAFYQNGGAYGFRDQLQDVLALLPHSPQRAKQQILLHAAHQFEEGDVLHWWHSVESGADRGIRTRFSDDLLWLPYVCLEYIKITGDAGILDETVGFVTGAPLTDGVDELYYEVGQAEASADIYTHMILAIRRALQFGDHGLLLMGSGDWNDGMSTVGNEGKGESVWLSWFMCDILDKMLPICRQRGEEKEAKSFAVIREDLAEAVNKNAWDGKWYLRAFFDDGSPLGSQANSECKIDALVQAWSVISRAGTPDKAAQAMESVKNHLVSKENGLIALLTPAFQNSDPSPGYIQSYVEGVRENGGQYTHAAVWVILAAALLGDGDTAWQYFHLINPVNHTQSTMEAARYKNEPYALSADVYTNPAHMGRAGWSFYTGAAGWYYKVGTEEILGLKKRGNKLYVEPCVPEEWDGFEVEYRFKKTVYHIRVVRDRTLEKQERVYDGIFHKDGCIKLEENKGKISVTVKFN